MTQINEKMDNAIINDGEKSFCKDCNSEDIGSVAPEEVI
jgi:hypothetical protein